MNPALIALDWGTSSARAMLVAPSGAVLARRGGGRGVSQLAAGAFEDALFDLCADWIEAHAVPILASGMVGSRQGWREAPYLAAPCGPDGCAAALTLVALTRAPGRSIHLLPGVSITRFDGTRDVMRGEEAQVWGCHSGAAATYVLPGTHSKWVDVNARSQISAFRTYMTGELFSLLSAHSSLRWQAAGEAGSAVQADAQFELGVRRALAHSAGLSSLMFQARAAALFGDVAAQGVPAFLSGLLIGAEVASALNVDKPSAGVKVIGEPQLCLLYQAALRICAVPAEVVDASDATARCALLVAQAAQLLKGK